MPNPLSADIRARLGQSLRSITRSPCPVNSIERDVLQVWCQLKSPRNTGHGKLDPHQDFLIEQIQLDPDITLKALQARRICRCA